MSKIEPNPTVNSPGLQYPSDLDLDPSNKEGFAFKNVFDNLFYLRRVVDNQASVGNTLNEAQIKALIKIAINRARIQGATAIVGTHAIRKTVYAAASGAVGAEFFETDRTSTYIISDASGGKKWVYAGGSMSGAFATRPADLGLVDAGFLFTDTTTDQETEYLWDGTEWLTIGGYLQSISDAVTNAVTTSQVLEHLCAGAGAAGMGTRQLYRLKDDTNTTGINAAGWKAVTTIAAVATYTSKLVAEIRSAGSAIADFFEITTLGIRIKVAGFYALLTHAAAADVSWTGPSETSSLAYATAALTSAKLVMGQGLAKLAAIANIDWNGSSLGISGDLKLLSAGNGHYIAEGANATSGKATLVAGTVVVSTTKVTANSRIQLTSQVDGGSPGFVRVTARTPGTDFTITSSDAGDTSDIAWLIVEPV